MASYTQRQYLKYTPAQLFGLVADVEKYPEFIPWITMARVRRRTDQTIWTDLTFGFGFLQKTFATVAALHRPHRISINSRDPMFTRFEQSWTFESLAEGGTNIEYHPELECRSNSVVDAHGYLVCQTRCRGRRGVYRSSAPSLWRAIVSRLWADPSPLLLCLSTASRTPE